jgi:bifunctional non-homologous end joining protein LigD
VIGPEVMLCSTRKGAPAQIISELVGSGGWWWELKLDGIRAVVRRDPEGAVSIFGRRQSDITFRYPDVVAAVQAQEFSGTLDGEIIVAGEGGRPDFALAHRRDAQQRPATARRMAAAFPATFVPFDVLDLDGRDLRGQSYEMRRAHLLRAWGSEGLSLASPDGATMWSFVQANRLEGLVAKLGSSPYRAGRRSPSWVKLKATRSVTVLVTGATPGKGSRGPVGALLMALWDPRTKTMVPVGRVGSGMTDADLGIAFSRLESGVPLLAEVEYLERSATGQLRMPIFRGFRDDVAPESCTIDTLS